MSEERGRGHGSGKLILFGEHAVVYGTPAIVAGLPRGAEATVEPAEGEEGRLRLLQSSGDDADGAEPAEISDPTVKAAFRAVLEVFEDLLEGPVDATVEMDIPVGVGLGSSASFGTALARAMADLTGAEDRVKKAVRAAEEVFHGNPSGIDQLAAMEGGLHFFRRGEKGMEAAPVEAPTFRVAVCVAGPASSTAAMVQKVADRRSRETDLVGHVERLIGDITRAASNSLTEGDWQRVGELMDINHGALVSLGVSTDELEQARYIAMRAGAAGAKLTGAGGGGCVVAIIPEDVGHGVVEAWSKAGLEAFEVEIGGH